MATEVNDYLSLDLSDEGAAIVYVKKPQADACTLLNYAVKSKLTLKSGRAQLKDFITAFLASNNIACRRAFLTIFDPDDVLIKNIIMPAVPKAELKEAIRWRIKEEESFDMEGALWDFRVSRESPDPAGAKIYDISLMACRPQVLKEYTGFLSDCGISLESVTAAPFNYEKIIEKLKPAGNVEAVLEAGESRVLLCVFNQKKLCFSRVIPLAANASGGASFSLIREVDSSFKYLVSSLRLEKPAVIYLSGSAGDGLQNHCAKTLDTVCRIMPLPDCLHFAAGQPSEFAQDQGRLLSALGAVLSGRPPVNLLSQGSGAGDIRKLAAVFKAAGKSVYLRLAVVFVVGLAVVSNLLLLVQKNRLKDAAKTKAGLQKEFSARYGVSSDDPLGRIRSGSIPVRGLLLALSELAPADIILEELTFEQAAHKLALKGKVMGSGGSQALGVMTFKENLGASPFIKSVQSPNLFKENNSQKFSLECETAG